MKTLSVVGSNIEIDLTHSDATRYTGTREDLIAAGYATLDMFPEGRKRTKYNLGSDLPDDLQFATHYVKGGRWEVRRWHAPREEREAWNPDAFRNNTRATAAAVFAVLIGTIKHGKTHRFTPVDQERIDRGFRDLLDVFAQAEVVRPESDRPYLRPVG